MLFSLGKEGYLVTPGLVNPRRGRGSNVDIRSVSLNQAFHPRGLVRRMTLQLLALRVETTLGSFRKQIPLWNSEWKIILLTVFHVYAPVKLCSFGRKVFSNKISTYHQVVPEIEV